jgi:trk system potassium uptake protein TrkH
MGLSIGAYGSATIEVIITVFMMLFAANFMLYYLIITGNFKRALKNEELRLYVLVFAASSLLIMLNIAPGNGGDFLTSFRHSAFQTASVMSTTGFSTVNYDNWPDMSKMIMLVLMLVGGCANSTSGAIKQARLLILIKSVGNHIKGIIQPRAVKQITVGNKSIDSDTVKEVQIFFFSYVFILFAACLIVSLDRMDIFSSFSAALASISNIGPSFGLVGPMSHYGQLTDLSKITLSFCMLLGRLEIFPVIVLFAPSLWAKKH